MYHKLPNINLSFHQFTLDTRGVCLRERSLLNNQNRYGPIDVTLDARGENRYLLTSKYTLLFLFFRLY